MWLRHQFTYSNVGYAAATEAMAELPGRTFDRLMDHDVLQVLQMTASRVGNPSFSENNITVPHYKINGVVQPVPLMSTDNRVGALGQVLSAGDAARWLAFHRANAAARIVSESRTLSGTES
jgi:CubicO group peptidase (beta-lactamase class C family)